VSNLVSHSKGEIYLKTADEVSNRKEINSHNEKLQNSYASPNISKVSKLRRIGWVGHVRTGAKLNS
jgi:hypothetical protein